jgi:hypothetical protein
LAGTIATQTFTNKTLTSPVLNTGVSGTAILDEDDMATNSDTQLATQQSIKAYVDANAGGGGGSAITVQDEGSSLATAAETINFVGAGVVASGTGTTKTITIGASNANTGDITFSGNEISTGSSNADFEISTSGTGMIVLKANGGSFDNFSTQSRYTNANIMYHEDLSHTAGSDRRYSNGMVSHYKLDGTDTSSSNYRLRNVSYVKVDLNGTDCTSSGSSRGAMTNIYSDLTNSSTSDSNQGNATAVGLGNYVFESGNTNNAGNVNHTNMHGMTIFPTEYDNMTGVVTNSYGIKASSPISYSYGGFTGDGLTVTNTYGYYYTHNGQETTFTNRPYAFYTDDDSVKNRPGAFDKFSEWSHNATHSANGAYTVDWANGNLQTVTLGANITGFTMSNFPTDIKRSVGVTLYLVQDGTGSRTMSFSATGGETFKFANGATTSPVSSANDIQTVYIFSRYNGSSNTFYWTLGPTYS